MTKFRGSHRKTCVVRQEPRGSAAGGSQEDSIGSVPGLSSLEQSGLFG